MKKKPASSTQVRINPEMSERIDKMRIDFYRVPLSRTAFVSMALDEGMLVLERQHNQDRADASVKEFVSRES